MSSSESPIPSLPALAAKAAEDHSFVTSWSPSDLRDLIMSVSTWAVQAYVKLREEGAQFDLVDPDSITATEAAVGALAMLGAANIEVFELAMWEGLGF